MFGMELEEWWALFIRRDIKGRAKCRGLLGKGSSQELQK